MVGDNVQSANNAVDCDNKTAETEKVEQRKSSKLFEKNYENVRTNISRLQEPNTNN